jgi:hypothetical protein
VDPVVRGRVRRSTCARQFGARWSFCQGLSNSWDSVTNGLTHLPVTTSANEEFCSDLMLQIATVIPEAWPCLERLAGPAPLHFELSAMPLLHL